MVDRSTKPRHTAASARAVHNYSSSARTRGELTVWWSWWPPKTKRNEISRREDFFIGVVEATVLCKPAHVSTYCRMCTVVEVGRVPKGVEERRMGKKLRTIASVYPISAVDKETKRKKKEMGTRSSVHIENRQDLREPSSRVIHI